MAYRIDLNLNCADRARYAQAAKDMGLDGKELVIALVHSFFESRGVKNPSSSSKFQKKIRRTRRV